MPDTLIKEQALGQLIISRGLAKQEHVKECISQIEEMHSLGANPLPSLAQLLLIKGYIDGPSYDKAMKLADETSALQSMLPSDLPPDVQKAAEDPNNDMEKFIKLKLLGKGGMGEVWKAWEKNLRRYVAIKFFRGHSFEDQKRFLREAQVVGQLSHPNIASVHEIAMHKDEPYLVMQLINGATIDNAGLDMKGALKAIRDAALALDFAHEHGFIHRDIKPANIMMEKEKVYLMDFGLARPTQVDSSISESGAIMGTPQYMSPEQARGESKLLDIRSDIYSLGATLYTLVCHRHAFDMAKDEPIIAIIRRIIDEEPPAPRKVNPNIPWEVETIILKAMEKDRERRYQSAKEMGEDIQRFMDGEPIRASRAKLTYRIRKKVAKHSGVVVTLAMLIVLGLAFGTYVLGSMMGIERKLVVWLEKAEAAETAQNWEEARVNYERAVALDPDNQRLIDKAAAMEKLAKEKHADLQEKAAKAVEFSKAKEVYQHAEKDLAALIQRSYAPRWTLEQQELDTLHDIVDRCMEQMKKTGETGHGWAVVGRAKLIVGDWTAAQEAFDAGVASEPGHMLCLSYQARLATKMAVLNGSSAPLKKASEDLAKIKDVSDIEADLAKAYALVAQQQPTQAFVEPLLAKYKGKEGWEEFHLARALSPDGRVDADSMQAVSARASCWEAYFIMAVSYLKRGDQRSAIASLDKIFAINEFNLDAYLIRGLARLNQGDYLKAIEDYNRALELKPKFAEAYLRRGLARRGSKDLRGAINDFTRAIEARSKYAEAYTLRGLTKRDLNDYNGAIADFTEAIKADPSYADAYAERGISLRDSVANLNGAYDDCIKATKKDPRSSKAFTYLGLVLEAKKDFQGAKKAHEDAIALAPHNGAAYCNLGRALLALGDQNGAMQNFNRAIEKSPSFAEAYVQRGMLHRAMRNNVSADQDLNKARDINRNLSETYITAGDTYFARKDYDRAIAEYDKAILLNKDVPRGFIQRGIAKEAKREYDQAIEDFGAALKLDPQDLDAYEARARVYLAKNKRAEAVADLTKMIEINPNNPDAYIKRGNMRLDMKDVNGAIQDFNKVVELLPNEASSFIERGKAKMKAGQHNSAQGDFTKAIGQDSSLEEPYVLRAECFRAMKQTSAAIADYLRAAERSREPAKMYVEMGLLREATGDDKGAMKDYERATELDSSLSAAFMLRGKLHFKKYDYYKAKEDFDRAVQLGPSEPHAYLARAEYHVKMNNHLDAIKDLNRAIENLTEQDKPGLEKALLTRAQMHQNRGDLDSVIADCSRVISLQTALGRPYYMRALTYQRQSYDAKNETKYNLLLMAMGDFKTSAERKDLTESEQSDASYRARSIQSQLEAMAPKPPTPPPGGNFNNPPPRQPPPPPRQQPPPNQPPPPPGQPPPGGDPFRGQGGYRGVGR